MNAPKDSCMMCALHGIWFLNAGYKNPEAWSDDYSLRAIE